MNDSAKIELAIVSATRHAFPAEAHHKKLADLLSGDLKTRGVNNIVLDGHLSEELKRIYPRFLFVTRGMLKDAREIKQNFPEKTVILLSGLIEEEDAMYGIIPIKKEKYAFVEEILSAIAR